MTRHRGHSLKVFVFVLISLTIFLSIHKNLIAPWLEEVLGKGFWSEQLAVGIVYGIMLVHVFLFVRSFRK